MKDTEKEGSLVLTGRRHADYALMNMYAYQSKEIKREQIHKLIRDLKNTSLHTYSLRSGDRPTLSDFSGLINYVLLCKKGRRFTQGSVASLNIGWTTLKEQAGLAHFKQPYTMQTSIFEFFYTDNRMV